MANPVFSHKRAVLLIVANSVGTGIFTTTGFALKDLQSPWLVMAVWILGALYSLLGVYCYAALHKTFPGSGGEYHFLSKGLHPYIGRVGGFTSMIAGFTAPLAAACFGFSVYLQRALHFDIPQTLTSVIVLTFIFAIHFFSLQKGMKWHDQFVFLKIIFFVLLTLFALTVGDWRLPSFQFQLNIKSFSNSFFWIAYAFSGWNAAYYVASEFLSNEDSVNKASYQGSLLVSFLYILINIPLLFAVDWTALQNSPDVVAQYFELNTGFSAERWVSALIATGLLSSISAFLVIAPRVYSRMAEDRALPHFFLFQSGEHPKRVLTFQFVITMITILFVPFEFILKYSGFALTICSLFSVTALVLNNQRRFDQKNILPLIYIALTSFLVYYGGPWFL